MGGRRWGLTPMTPRGRLDEKYFRDLMKMIGWTLVFFLLFGTALALMFGV